MDQILQGLSGVQCVLDDMIITGKSDDEHLQNLENVLQRLQDNGLPCKIWSIARCQIDGADAIPNVSRLYS
jgi:hypothetical protein